MLPHTMNEGTFEAPNGTIQGKAARWEGEGRALAASVFTGFNLADVPDAALSVVVVTDGDSAGAQAMTDELLTDAWAARARSEEHTSELQSLMRISYAVFCLNIKYKHTFISPYLSVTMLV